MSPLCAVNGAEMVCAIAIGISEPSGLFVGILVPYFCAEVAKVFCAGFAVEKSDAFANDGLEVEFFSGDGGKGL